jgi:hypothetical protein
VVVVVEVDNVVAVILLRRGAIMVRYKLRMTGFFQYDANVDADVSVILEMSG